MSSTEVDSLAALVEEAQLQGDRRKAIEALLLLSEQVRSRAAESGALLRRASAMADTLADPRLIAITSARRIFPEYQQGYYYSAITLGRRAQQLLDSLNLPEEKARMLLSLGSTYGRMGDYDTARRELNRGLMIARSLGDQRLEAAFLNNLGESFKRARDYAQALSYYQWSREVSARIGSPVYVQLDNLGEIATYLNRFAQADSLLTQSLTISQRLKDTRLIAASRCNLGRLELRKGRLSLAAQQLSAAAALAKASSLIERELECQKLLNTVYAQQGDLKRAYEAAERSLVLLDSQWVRQARITVADLQTSVEIAEARRVLENLDRQLAADRRVQWSLVAAIVLLVISVLILAAMYRRRREANREAFRQNQALQLTQQRLESAYASIAQKAIALEKTHAGIADQRDELTTSLTEYEGQAEQLESSLEYASRIQQALLPDAERLQGIFTEHVLIYQPVQLVSGNFYFVQEAGHKSVVVVSDCAGDGVPSALLGMIADAMLTQLVLDRGIIDAGTLAAELDRGIRRALSSALLPDENSSAPAVAFDQSIALAVVVIDRQQRSINFAGAGLPLIYIHRKKLYTIAGNPQRIAGAQREQEFIAHYLMYDASSTFYLMTPGLANQIQHNSDQSFGEQRLREYLLNTVDLGLSRQAQALREEWARWRGGAKQSDDILYLAFVV